MYKLIYEYKEHFRVIVIAISAESKHNHETFKKTFSRLESSLLYWNNTRGGLTLKLPGSVAQPR